MWLYLCDNCDIAGVWKPTWKLAEFQMGCSLDPEEVLEAMGGRVTVLDNGKWFIATLIEFQQGGSLNPKNLCHKSILRLLEENGVDVVQGENGRFFVSETSKQSKPLPSPLAGASQPLRRGYSNSNSNSTGTDPHVRACACEADDLDLIPDPPTPKRNIDREAEAIYAEYPLKVGRPVALRAIKKQLARFPFEELLAKTKAYAEARAGDKEFVPHPSTWFNQQRFNDDPSTWTRSEPAQGKPKPNLLDADTYL